MKSPRKKKNRVRQKDWSEGSDRAFSRDLKRHRRTNTALSANAPGPELPENFTPNAVVLEHTKKYAFVQMDGQEVQCRISRHVLEDSATLLAPGDEVYVDDWEGEPWVFALAPRRSRLSRPAIEGSRVEEQIFAANVDNLIIVAAAAQPRFKPGLVDRYLIAAQLGGVQPILCVNKIDLVDGEPAAVAPYHELGIPVILASCVTGQGFDELRARFHNRTSVLAGQSGVGKSSLLNALFPELKLRTQEVSDANEKGRHTTTTARLYTLDHGVRVIDTPGIRKLGLWGITPRELDFYFPDLAEHAVNCRFRDCTHLHEPDCAVQDAVERGLIPQGRFRSYLRIRENLEEQTAH